MYFSLNRARGYGAQTVDGRVGRIHDFVLEGEPPALRHVLVDLRSSWPGRRVGVPVEQVVALEPLGQALHLALQRRQLEKQPEWSSSALLPSALASRGRSLLPLEAESPRVAVMPLTPVGLSSARLSTEPRLPAILARAAVVEEPAGRRRSWCFRELRGRRVTARDRPVGHVDDLVADSEGWKPCRLVLRTARWPAGRQVSVPLRCLESIDWEGGRVRLDLPASAIERAPEHRLESVPVLEAEESAEAGTASRSQG